MRVTHVCLRYPPASGGVEDYTQQLVERLRASGDEVFVETTMLRTHHPATFLPEPFSDPPYVHRHPVRTLGPIAYPLPVSLSSTLLGHPWGTPTDREAILRGPQPYGSRSNPKGTPVARSPASALVHAHGFWYSPADIAARAARRLPVPFVLNPYYAPRKKLLWRAYRALIGNRTLNAADAVVVISPQEEAALRADGFAPRRTELIPPGIDPEEFAVRRENPYAAHGIHEKRVLFFAGRIARAKGIDLLLYALSVILSNAKDLGADIHLALAGEDFGERAAFEALAEHLGVSRAVTWLGKLPREELIAAYQHASVFVFPSRYEAFGIAPLEAQAAGCPVVAMNTASLPFVVQHERTGLLFRPEDPGDLATQVLALLNDRERARALGAAGRERAHREFTWEKSLQKLRLLYADLLSAS